MRTPFTGWTSAFLLLALLIPPSITFAQSVKTVREQLEPAWLQANRLLDGALNPKQQSEFNTLAYSAAVANLCEGFALSQERFKKGFNYSLTNSYLYVVNEPTPKLSVYIHQSISCLWRCHHER